MVESFLQELASGERPVPGGGAAAAYGGSVALALLEKVVRLEGKRPQAALPDPSQWRTMLAEVRELGRRLDDLRDRDGEAYLRWVAARTAVDTASRSATERAAGSAGAALQQAWTELVACPMAIMDRAFYALGLVERTGEQCRRHLLVDLLAAAALLDGAGRAAYHIACANLGPGADSAAMYGERLERLRAAAGERFLEVERKILERIQASTRQLRS